MSLACLLAALLTAAPVVPLCDFEQPLALHPGGEGVQTGSTATLDTAQAHSGKQAVKLHCRFIAAPKGLQYFGFGADLVIPMRLSKFSAWVLGDGSKLPVNLRLMDRSGETFQFTLGRLDFVGWRQMQVAIADGGLCWGGDGNKRLDPPLRLNLLLVDSQRNAGDSDVWVDDLSYQPEVPVKPLWAEPVALPVPPRMGGENVRPTWQVTPQNGGYAIQYAFDTAGPREHLDLAVGAPLPPAESLAVDVDSDGQGQILRFQLLDAGGETHQLTYGPLLWQGNLRCEVALTAGDHWGGDNNGRLDLPVKLQAIIIDRGRPAAGTIGLRDLTVTPARGPAKPRRLCLETADGATPAVAGDQAQPGSKLVADPAVKHDGGGSWRLDYQFVKQDGLQYLEVPLHRPLGPSPKPLRFWFKGDGSKNSLRLRCTDSKGEWHQYNLGDSTNTDWREVVCDFAAPHGCWFGDKNGKLDGSVSLVSLLLDANVRPSQGSVWFDQVTAEAELPAAELLVPTLEPDDGRWMVGAGQPVKLNLTWTDQREPRTPLKLPVRCVFTDAAGHVRQDLHAESDLRAGAAPTTLTVTAPRTGCYQVTLIWRLEDDFSHRTVSLAVMPPQPETNVATNPLGACLHFEQGKGKLPLTYDLLKACGARWSRDEYSWGQVERTKGEYTFPARNDAYLRAAHERGIEPLIILDYGNRLYDGGNSPASDEAQDAFARYAFEMVRHYKGVCRYWEVYNEPNISFWKPKPDPVAYARLLKKTYAACKKADPDCVVVGICTAGTDLRYIEKVLQEGAGPSMDALSVHPYRYPRSPEESGFVAELEKCHALMVKYGIGDKPIWITEIGWPNQKDPRGSTQAQSANYLVRMVALARALPYMGPIIWYDFQDDGWDESYNEANFGLIRPDYSPKQPYFAAAMMNRVLATKRFARTLPAESPVSAQEYTGAGGERTIVLWSTPVESRVALTVDAPEVELSDVTGTIEPRLLKGGRLVLNLGEEPVFVTGRFSTATLLPEPLAVAATEPTWPGRTAVLSCRLANWSDTARTVQLTAAPPAGWTAQAAPVPLPAGGQAVGELRLAVPAGAVPGDYAVTVRDGAQQVEATVTVQDPLAVRVVPQRTGASWRIGALVRNATDRPLGGFRLAAADAPAVAVPELPAGGQAEVATAATPPAAGPAESVPVRLLVQRDGQGLARVGHTNFWAVPRLAALKLDGQLDEWSAVPAVLVTDWQTPESVPAKAAADLSATARLAYTSAGLALVVQVRDDQHFAVDPPESGWQGDGVQVAVDTGWDTRAGNEPFAEIGLTLGRGGPVAWRFSPRDGALPAGTLAAVRQGDQTIYEALLPWPELGLQQPTLGRRLGFGLLINENDGHGREGWLQLFSGIGWTKQASELGVVVLAG